MDSTRKLAHVSRTSMNSFSLARYDLVICKEEAHPHLSIGQSYTPFHQAEAYHLPLLPLTDCYRFDMLALLSISSQ